MKRLPDYEDTRRAKSIWLRPGTNWVECVVCSEVEWFYGHWDKAAGRTRRCGGAACALCEIGQARQPFFYLGVQSGSDRLQVIEIGRSLRPLAEDLLKAGVDAIGTKVKIRKKGVERNAPFLFEVIGREPCDELTLAPFVATLGLEPLLTLEVETDLNRLRRYIT